MATRPQLFAVLCALIAVYSGLGAARVLQQSNEFPSSGAFFDANQGDTSTFVALVKAAGMDPTALKGTIIVPENKAISSLLSSLGLSAQQLLGSRRLAMALAQYHMSRRSVSKEQANDVRELDTKYEGDDLDVIASGGSISFQGDQNRANVLRSSSVGTGSNVDAVLYVVDAVLLPEGVTSLLPSTSPMAEKDD